MTHLVSGHSLRKRKSYRLLKEKLSTNFSSNHLQESEGISSQNSCLGSSGTQVLMLCEMQVPSLILNLSNADLDLVWDALWRVQSLIIYIGAAHIKRDFS